MVELSAGLLILILSVVIYEVKCNIQPINLNPTVIPSSKTIGDCQACKLFIDSFTKGLKRTARGKFEGGDAAWEEEKLKSYRRSEIRLVEIQESICKEVKDYSIQCHHMAEKAEEIVENWWSSSTEDSDDIFSYVCIENLKVCCPKNHYGKDCLPCSSDLSNICSGNGKCKGDGTRKGNGKCQCDVGYKGELCNECSDSYIETYRDKSKLLCSACHFSCEGNCNQTGPKGCSACKTGWTMDEEEGCLDINECDDLNKCKKEQFCVNTEGSFQCLQCDRSCESCYGDGPDLCRKCAEGYSKKGEFCIADREDEHHDDQLTTTRSESRNKNIDEL